MNIAWKKIEQTYDELAKLDDTSRHARLDTLAQTDPSLHEEVVRLLRASALDSAPTDPMTTMYSAAVPGEGVPLGESLGAYALRESLGAGGMGEVFRAERRDGDLVQTVAIKVLRTMAVTPEAKERFLIEQAILARLEHPYLARYIDHGVSDQGQPYLVMEYVDGVDVITYCRTQGLAWEARIRLFLLVCQAVEHAHRSLVVHQDIKPDNVLVTAEGIPRLLDFGIAGIASEETPLSFSGLTLPYSSPEQIAEESLTARADQYSLGVLLYQMLTNELPYFAATRESQLKLIYGGLPQKLSLGPLSERRARELRAILTRSLAPDASRRYESVHDLVLDLTAFLENRPVEAVAGGSAYRAAKFLTRFRREFTLLAFAAVIVAAISGVYLKQHEQAVRALAAQEARAARVASFMLGVFAQVDPAQSQGELDAVALLTNARDRARREFGQDPAVEVQIMGAIGRSLRELGIYKEAIAIHEEVLDRHEAFLQTEPLVRAQALFDRAYIAMETGRFAQAVELHAEAYALRNTLLDAPHPDLADSLRELGYVYLEEGDEAASARNLQAAADMYQALGTEYVSAWASTRMDQAGALRRENRFEEALAICLEVLEIQEATYGEVHPLVAQSHHNSSVVASDLGDFERAGFHAKAAIRLRTKLFGADHPATLASHLSTMRQALQQGDIWQGIADGQTILERAAEAEFRWFDTIYSRLTHAHLILGDRSAAKATLQTWRAYLVDSGTSSRRLPGAEAHFEFARGNYAAALEKFGPEENRRADAFFDIEPAHAATMLDPVSGLQQMSETVSLYLSNTPHPTRAPWDHLLMASAFLATGDAARVRQHVENALSYADQVWSPEAVMHAVFRIRLGMLSLDLDARQAARDHLLVAVRVRDGLRDKVAGGEAERRLLDRQLDELARAIDAADAQAR